jgi:hypothetical protein
MSSINSFEGVNLDNGLKKMIYQARFNHNGSQLERRIKALEQTRLVDGKPTSYGKYLHDYVRGMAFTYHASGANAAKYRRIVSLVEEMASKQWGTFKECK